MTEPRLTPNAKAIIAALGAVIVAGITAGQQFRGGTFRLVDVLPVAVVVLGAAQTHLIPNVPELPWAKAVVSGASAVLAAVATLVAQDPSGVTAAKLLTVAVAAFLVWFVPELAPALKVIEGEIASGAPLPQLAATVAADVADSHSPWMAEPTAPPAAPVPTGGPTEPTPLADAAARAAALAHAATGPLPAVTA